MASKSLNAKRVNRMSGKVVKKKCTVKKGEEITRKDMLRRMRRMEKSVHELKDKIKKQKLQERKLHRQQLQNTKRQFLEKIKKIREIHERDIKQEWERSNEQNVSTLAFAVQVAQQLQWQRMRMDYHHASSMHQHRAIRAHAVRLDQSLDDHNTRIMNLQASSMRETVATRAYAQRLGEYLNTRINNLSRAFVPAAEQPPRNRVEE